MSSRRDWWLALGRKVGLWPGHGWQARFEFFVTHGLLESVPHPRQIETATVEMMPFAFNETPIEYAANRTSIWGHIPLRVPLQLLYCPQQAIVWNGLLATPHTLVKHLLSAFHEDGVIAYDLQLLQSHPGGLELLERSAEEVASGEHPLAPMLSAIAGGYHAHLAELARAARRFEYPADLDPRFSSFVGFSRYCLQLPIPP
ncbi:hypothetical protein [Hyalangium rubrum]|uniref:Uncharacterized protein n=1 Tax=Hyalangium rubrum TaxID=3103134 RepID=A0ABU5GWM9_9BACT|nr:hypothetical protein [Hyalangium sp. s54d21]MDY7225588.1 hypothetical protein [Hyalangium sp. s54d21]